MSCSGPEPNQCTRCEKGLVLDPNTLLCGVTGDTDCPSGTYLHDDQFTCMGCHRHCYTCEGPGNDECQTCATPRYLHSELSLLMFNSKQRSSSGCKNVCQECQTNFGFVCVFQSASVGANKLSIELWLCAIFQTAAVWVSVQLVHTSQGRKLMERSWDSVHLVTTSAPPALEHRQETASPVLQDTWTSLTAVSPIVPQGTKLASSSFGNICFMKQKRLLTFSPPLIHWWVHKRFGREPEWLVDVIQFLYKFSELSNFPGNLDKVLF